MKDILGTALLDYYHGNYTQDIITETNISEEDVLPLPYLFRSYDEMPSIEKKALYLAKGRILDVGCGAGIHTLYLQNKGFTSKSIDVSKGAIEVCKLQGVKDASVLDLLDMKIDPSTPDSQQKFDTILMLMNGTGIFGKLQNVSKYLQHLKGLLSEKGQILIDTSDLKYMYDEGEVKGSIIVPAEMDYYGELQFTMHYKGKNTEPFDWLYLDKHTFEALCEENGFTFEIVERGENFDYLARLKHLDF